MMVPPNQFLRGQIMEIDENDDGARILLRERIASVLDRAESAYLKILRAAILVIATGLVLYAAVLASFSAYKVLRSPSSVHEEVATVAANELVSAEAPVTPAQPGAGGTHANAAQRRGYEQFLNGYYQLYRARFEPFRQSEDHPLGRAEFDDRFVGVQTRLGAVAQGEVNYETDIADLQTLLRTMTEAATLPTTQQRLDRYKAARKVQSCQNVERTRPTVTVGWDSLSMSCPNWYINGGCAVSRTVQTPYTARECSMRFPEGTQSHLQIFRAYQDRYFSLLSDRRTENTARAQASRQEIVAGNVAGKLNLWTSLMILIGFLVLMFFFLLIAIERHQRHLAAHLQSD